MKHLGPAVAILAPTLFWTFVYWRTGWRHLAIAFAIFGVVLTILVGVVFAI